MNEVTKLWGPVERGLRPPLCQCPTLAVFYPVTSLKYPRNGQPNSMLSLFPGLQRVQNLPLTFIDILLPQQVYLELCPCLSWSRTEETHVMVLGLHRIWHWIWQQSPSLFQAQSSPQATLPPPSSAPFLPSLHLLPASKTAKNTQLPVDLMALRYSTTCRCSNTSSTLQPLAVMCLASLLLHGHTMVWTYHRC